MKVPAGINTISGGQGLTLAAKADELVNSEMSVIT
ncbi:hypothetical protein B6N60_00522 [Richelia sinica FACHB-800]|uniref:Uncharacterized protein n=1 Tax=Richelia sinica FACHB-800 TaxID=1357546 RepID=A0A975T4A6_9NOST|nr:hypothetical protein B6N60_00522 [Richelia sinica FACHB-800]